MVLVERMEHQVLTEQVVHQEQMVLQALQVRAELMVLAELMVRPAQVVVRVHQGLAVQTVLVEQMEHRGQVALQE